MRYGTIDSIKTEENHLMVIVKDAFRMEENIKDYSTLTDDQINPKYDVLVKCLEGTEGGVLKGPFAKMGKCKVQFPLNAMTSSIQVGDKVEIIIQKKIV